MNIVSGLNIRSCVFKLLWVINVLWIFPNATKSQVYPGSRLVTFSGKIRVADFFQIVYSQTRMLAFHNEDQISADELIDVDFKCTPLDAVLLEVLSKRCLSWCYKQSTFVVKVPKPMDYDLPKDIWTITQSKVSNVRDFEGRNKSDVQFKKDDLANSEYPLNHRYTLTSYPLTAKRKDGQQSLKVYASYFYTPIDSIVRLVIYDWTRIYQSSFDNERSLEADNERKIICAEEHKKKNLYRGQFNQVRELLCRKFGQPNIVDNEKYYSLWNLGCMEVELKLVFLQDNHCVRLKIYWH